MVKQLSAIVHDTPVVGICDYSSLENKETCQYNSNAAHAVPSTDESSVARNAKATKQWVAQQNNIPLNQMQSRCSLDHRRNLARLQGKGRVLELLLHVTVSEESPVSIGVSGFLGLYKRHV